MLPAPIRRRLHLKTRSKVELEERPDGVFIRPMTRSTPVEPIDYPPADSLKMNRRMLEQDHLFAQESV